MGTETTPVIPAHLNASDFTLYNATPAMIAQFQLALDTTQNGNDEAGTAIIQAMWLNGGRVVFNPFDTASDAAMAKLTPEIAQKLGDHQGIDFYDAETHAVYWNPNSALQISDVNGNLLGVQSPRLGFIHEAAHSLDEQLIVHLEERIPQWKNNAEYLATDYENMSAKTNNEPMRDHYAAEPVGNTIYVTNSTMHTGVDAFGNPVWMQTNQFGVTETGPIYGFQKIAPVWYDVAVPPDPGKAPVFGSTIPPGYYNDGDDSGYFNDGGYHAGPQAPAVAYTDQGIIAYDAQGKPYVFHNPPTPDPSQIITLDPQNGNGDNNDDSGDNDHDSGDDNVGNDTGQSNVAYPDNGGGDNSDTGCVAIESFLPDRRRAGSIEVSNTMQLADPNTLQPTTGIVTYSEEKTAYGYRIVTESGATLVCSDTAPIPVRARGLMTPVNLLGEEVAVRRDDNATTTAGWEKVTSVEHVGRIRVQHITVGNQCFWAGEQKGAYILHHNMKQAGGSDDGDGSDFQTVFMGIWSQKSPYTMQDTVAPAPHEPQGGGAIVVGVPHALEGGHFG